ncbi:hypothetical protein [Plasticicumulans sp.]|uniref:hypothetical protein n=1 Tax=Plasticicumulans sp. TaxID=2307179 RepID=UPI0039255EB9
MVSIGTPARSAQARAQAQAHDRAGHAAMSCPALLPRLHRRAEFRVRARTAAAAAGLLPPYRLARHVSPISNRRIDRHATTRSAP